MPDALQSFDWHPMAVLPNLSAQRPLQGSVIAIASVGDPRLVAFCRQHPKFKDFVSRFTDAFRVPLDPAILIVRNDILTRVAEVDPLASFRDLVALATIPQARAHAAEFHRPQGIMYADSLWLYPWMLGKNNENIVLNTPALQSAHAMEQFHGQSSPSIPELEIDKCDEQLFAALVARWERYYLGSRRTREDRVLFRSLNMATQAAQLPAGVDVTLYDLGRLVGLWVAAFEILAHPGTPSGRSGLHQVYASLDSAPCRNKQLQRRSYFASGKPKIRRSRLCYLYGKLYDARNNFLHGNPVRASSLSPLGTKLFWVAPCLYRVALASFLHLPIEDYLSDDFTRFERIDRQRSIERALLPLRKQQP